MKAAVIKLDKYFKTLDWELISHAWIIALLLIISILYGMNTMPEERVLREQETVQRASGIDLQKDIFLSTESLLAAGNEFVPEEVELEPVAPATEVKDVVLETKTPSVTVKPETITPDATVESAPVLVPELSFEGELRKDYCVGETLDISGLKILFGEENISLEDCVVTGGDTSIAGDFVVTISYKEMLLEIPYTVVNYQANVVNLGYEMLIPLHNYTIPESTIIPARLGKEFAGWYRDEACTVPFVTAIPGETVVDLYAGWKDFDRFACDEAGYITSYTGAFGSITDGLLNLVDHPSCIGVRASAFVGMEEFVTDIYVPAYITNIEAGAFDAMPYVFFIYVHPDNPAYTSEAGILYTKDMSTVVAYPSGR